MHTKMSREMSKNVNQPISHWDAAISDAEKKIQEAVEKITKLRESIKIFKKLRDSGEPFPGETVRRNEAGA